MWEFITVVAVFVLCVLRSIIIRCWPDSGLTAWLTGDYDGGSSSSEDWGDFGDGGGGGGD